MVGKHAANMTASRAYIRACFVIIEVCLGRLLCCFIYPIKYPFQQFAGNWLNLTLKIQSIKYIKKSQKAWDFVKSNTRYTAKEITSMIAIPKWASLNNLRRILKMKKKSACLVPNLLKESQKHALVKLFHEAFKYTFQQIADASFQI